MAWLYVRVDEMKKALEQTQIDVAALRSALAGAQSDLAQARSNIAGVNSGVAYATSLAENANRYAHSHNSYSDARLKTDVAEIPNALDGVLALHGVSYRWNTTGFPAMLLDDGPLIDFIAQEVERLYPELVPTAPNGYKTVDYDRLTPILVEAMKQQQSAIEALQKHLVALEAQR